MSALLLIGPAVAVIGIVAIVFVMRHKSVEKRSMYSARRSQIEHKVRAARQRTLAPGKRGEKADRATPPEESTIPPAPILTYEPSAFAGPPVAPPPKKTQGGQPAWDTGSTAAAAPSTPTFSAPVQPPPPAYEAPPYEVPAAEPTWNPTAEPPQPEPAAPPPAAQTAPAGAGASWSVVGETPKTGAEAEAPKKKKRSKEDAIQQATGSWQLASGEAASDDADEDVVRKPTAVVAIAQYAVLVVGLVMVLIGVVVMVANSKVT